MIWGVVVDVGLPSTCYVVLLGFQSGCPQVRDSDGDVIFGSVFCLAVAENNSRWVAFMEDFSKTCRSY